MKIGVIVQARTGSTRFPKKILKDLPYGSGITILNNVINRLKKVRKIDKIIIATTELSEDNIIIEIAKQNDILSFRGNVNDVLSRYYYAAKKYNVRIIVRVTSDCPCIDPGLLDKMIDLYINSSYDYICIDTEKYPRGVDAEIFNFEILESVFLNAHDNYDREHVTHYIYSNPEKFSIFRIQPDKNYENSEKQHIRITIDTFDDYILLCAIFDLLKDKTHYTLNDIFEIFRDHPWLYLVNELIQQKRLYNNLEEEIPNAILILKKNELSHSAQLLEFLLKNNNEFLKLNKKIVNYKNEIKKKEN